MKELNEDIKTNNMNTEEDKPKENKKTEERKFNFTPFEATNYSKFDEMRKELDNHFSQVYASVKDNLKIEGEAFKKPFFNSLENLLIQICLVKDQKLKVNKINDVYKWFNKRWKFHLNISKIDKRTKSTTYEKYPLPETYKQKEKTDISNNTISQNRTKIEGMESLRFK